jgi:cold shock CspA family protein
MPHLFDDPDLDRKIRFESKRGAPTRDPAPTKRETPMTIKRFTGTLRFYNSVKGYGFATPDHDPDGSVFIGQRSLIASGVLASSLTKDTRLSFRLIDATRGPAAVDIALLITDESTTSPAACPACGGVAKHAWNCARREAA